MRDKERTSQILQRCGIKLLDYQRKILDAMLQDKPVVINRGRRWTTAELTSWSLQQTERVRITKKLPRREDNRILGNSGQVIIDEYAFEPTKTTD